MFHVGSARSALFNWVFARQRGGALVLRIEDTDAARNSPEWTDGIIRAMAGLGMTPETDEGPYLQSSYAEAHREAATRLYEAGRAHYCDCTRGQVQARAGGPFTGYDSYSAGGGEG